MNNRQHTIEWFKRQAKNLKKERKITHTEALEILSKQAGYANWQHCQRSLNEMPIQELKPAVVPVEISFTNWLKKHKNRDSPLGDLALDMLRDPKWPSYNTLEEYRDYLIYRSAYDGAIDALERAWKAYKGYLKLKSNPASVKLKVKKQVTEGRDNRRIVYIKDITPLHYTKRTVETFDVGDKAWISYDGIKAIPVTILEVSNIYYTFRKDRPLKDAKDEYFLRLDEVRSTPELACMNYVTF